MTIENGSGLGCWIHKMPNVRSQMTNECQIIKNAPSTLEFLRFGTCLGFGAWSLVFCAAQQRLGR